MRGLDSRQLVVIYIGLATSCVFLGIGITFVVLLICAHLGIDVSKHLWVLTIPAASALILNVFFIELYLKLRRR
jgi:hypothetical protein